MSRRQLRRRAHARNRRLARLGQGLVEFAIVLPILILIMLIALDFGRLFFSYVTLNNATRIAANFGATDPAAFTGTPNTTTYNAIVAKETTGLNCALQADSSGNNPPLPTFPAGNTLGGMSVATMTCNFNLITPIIGGFFGGHVPITASAQFPIRTGAISNIGGGTTLPPPGAPVANFTFTGVSGGTIDGSGNVTGTDPVTVNVADASTNAQTWSWDWGDGSPPFTDGSNPGSHQFPGANSYNVTLTVTNTQGSSTFSRHVTVNPVSSGPPVAGFYGTPAGSPPAATGGGSGGAAIQGSEPLVVNFTNNSTNGGTAWSWDFGDGSGPSTSASPQHQYSKLGIFTVTLTITAPTGGTPLTRTNYVTVGCVVPNFAGTSTANADSAWTAAGFTGSTRYRQNGNSGNGNPNPPSPSKTIVGQSLAGGNFEQPTKKGNSYDCNYDIVLDYQ